MLLFLCLLVVMAHKDMMQSCLCLLVNICTPELWLPGSQHAQHTSYLQTSKYLVLFVQTWAAESLHIFKQTPRRSSQVCLALDKSREMLTTLPLKEQECSKYVCMLSGCRQHVGRHALGGTEYDSALGLSALFW